MLNDELDTKRLVNWFVSRTNYVPFLWYDDLIIKHTNDLIRGLYLDKLNLFSYQNLTKGYMHLNTNKNIRESSPFSYT